jgi:hypothetical protein
MLSSEHAREHGLQCNRVGRDQSDSSPQQSRHSLFSRRKGRMSRPPLTPTGTEAPEVVRPVRRPGYLRSDEDRLKEKPALH